MPELLWGDTSAVSIAGFILKRTDYADGDLYRSHQYDKRHRYPADPAAAVCFCFGTIQSGFFDANQVRMGTLVRPVSAESENLELMTHDGYLITVSTALGAVGAPTGSMPDTLLFTGTDCTGSAYFAIKNDWMRSRDGQIIRIGPLPGDLFRIEWGQSEAIEAYSMLAFFEPQCIPLEEPLLEPEAVLATSVTPGVYGISLIETESGFVRGFQPPFTTSVDKPNIISCNGFESCPVQ